MGSAPRWCRGELSHAIHFSLLTEAKRDRIASDYVRFIAFDIVGGRDGTHELDKETDPTVAFLEALDHFATRFAIFQLRHPGRPIDTALRRDFLQHELDGGRVAELDGPLATGTVTPNDGLESSSVEGAVYGAIFLDLARRTGVGLSRAVRAYFDSRAITFGQFRTFVDDQRPELSAALDDVRGDLGYVGAGRPGIRRAVGGMMAAGMPSPDRDRWLVLSPYLDEALDLPTEARPAWLASLEVSDSQLAAELRALLAEQAGLDASGYLEGDTADRPTPDPRASLAGQVVGAYRLVSTLGHGGMGTVWLAERCDGRFEGRAAVKLLNLALLGRAVEGRFQREGTILARLTHPNIAHLIDAGVTTSGQPYLVIELVDGQHLDRHCAEHALPIDRRLTLFLDVLQAVAHAHANLVVHRDLKPSNVLVSAAGQVKLLDFGIAKLVADEERRADADAVTSALTRDAGAAMTPQFAAPEQLTEGHVTTATDVYALGVLLYVLLTGRHPMADAVESPARLIRAIVDDEPPRMSDAVDGPPADAAARAEHATRCGTTPARLRRTLRGDLDTIVARAMKKAPAERYGSAAAMADDIHRYLDGEPIAARPDTLRYRAAKFVGRHTSSVAASVAVAVVVIALVVFYTTRLAAERDRAQREAARASSVSEALTGLLMGADPIANRATGESLTVRGLIDAGAEKARAGLEGQPEAQADILTVLGRLYRQFGIYDRAVPLLEQALAGAQKVYGSEHLRVAQALNELGAVLSRKATSRPPRTGSARRSTSAAACSAPSTPMSR